MHVCLNFAVPVLLLDCSLLSFSEEWSDLKITILCTTCNLYIIIRKDTVARFLLHLASSKKALSKSLPGVRQVKSITVTVAQMPLCCCFRTAPTAFTWTSRVRRGKVGHRYRILLLLATDAARRPGLNVVLCV